MTKFQAGTILHTSQVMDCQLHVIGKAIRPLIADPVTYIATWVFIYSLLTKIVSSLVPF